MLSVHHLLSRTRSTIHAGMALICVLSSLSIAQNGVLRQVWNNISGTTVANLTSNASYPNSPSSSGTISMFEGQQQAGDNYGARYRGFVVPPTTGSYTFWIASDDNSELWLSTTSNPANATLIASVTGYCTSRQWTKYTSQQSQAITLQANQQYYIEALHKDGTQNDNLAVGWQGPGISGDAERPIPNNRLRVWNTTQYTLTTTNDGHGTTTPTSNVTLNSGVAQSITATPATGYQFANWTVTSGSATFANANSASTTVTLSNSNATIRANFTAVNYTLTVANSGNGTTSPSGNVTVGHGVTTTINATANANYQFSSWTVTSGTATIANPTAASTQVTLTSGNATVTANFVASTYSLTVTTSGSGTTNPSGTVTVAPGTATSISASPASGNAFVNWTVASGTATIANPSSASTTVTLTSGNATIRANFTGVTYVLTVAAGSNGTTNPSGNVTVNSGAATSIAATANSGYRFSAWTVTTGTATIANPASASTTVTLNSGNAAVTATFAAIPCTLTVAAGANGTTTPSGAVIVNSGAATEITAIPNSGYQFSNWTVTSGTAVIANPTSAATSVTMTSGRATVTANFVLSTVNLTMATNGSGGTTTPSGTVAVVPGVATNVTATPNTGYQFTTWSVPVGAVTVGSLTSPTTTAIIVANATLQANFALRTYTLTVANSGNGTTSPSGAVTVNHGAATSITATPNSGYQFTGWTVTSGTATIASPSSAATTVSLTSGNATVSASFSQIAYVLTVAAGANGTTVPSGAVPVGHGVATSITANPNSGYHFVSWNVTSGTATIANPSSASTTVTLTSGNASIGATFAATTYTLTINPSANGTTTPSGTVTVEQGVPRSISATPNSGFLFSTWTVVTGNAVFASPASATTTVTLSTGNATIAAQFIPSPTAKPTSRRIAISGTLADADGNPVGSPTPVTIAVQVNITPTADGGTPLYTETFLPQNSNGITVENGRFVVTLGTGVANAELADVLAANQNCYAEITILGDTPDMLLPRTAITASPYTLGGSPASNELHGNGYPASLDIQARVGTYYVNDDDQTTWVRVQSGWKQID